MEGHGANVDVDMAGVGGKGGSVDLARQAPPLSSETSYTDSTTAWGETSLLRVDRCGRCNIRLIGS